MICQQRKYSSQYFGNYNYRNQVLDEILICLKLNTKPGSDTSTNVAVV